MVNKSVLKRKLRGGMVRSGSVQHFRRGKGKSVLKRKLRGGMVRPGSVQHFRRGKGKSVLKRKKRYVKTKHSLKSFRLKKH
jgi:hypothetical protein